jgi:spermidine synthase
MLTHRISWKSCFAAASPAAVGSGQSQSAAPAASPVGSRKSGGREGVAPVGRHVVRIGEDDGRAALLVDGVVQSISPMDGATRGGYWAAMVPPFKPSRALILGLGGGTLAHLLVDRWGANTHIVGVDDDPSVLEVARAAGWLSLPDLKIVEADAFAFVNTCDERFDYVALDLYRGPHLVGGGLTKPFLRRVRALLKPGGWLAANLFRDSRTALRIERIARVFPVEQPVHMGDNVVVFARKRRE